MHFTLAFFAASVKPSEEEVPLWDKPIEVVEFQLLPFDDAFDCDEAVFAMVVANKVDSPLHIGRFTLLEVRHWRVAIKK